MTSKEAIKILYEERAYTYDEKVNHKGDNWKEAIEHYDRIGGCLLAIQADLEILDWLIEKMYVAPALLELKVCPMNNPTVLKYHNAIETHDERFNKFIDRIHFLKYGR